jgi:hypothetical protein
MRTEDLDTVALMARDVGNINHAHIHTDISYIRGRMSVYETISYPVTQAAVKAIGITYGQGGDARGANKLSTTAITYSLAFGHIVYL